MTSPLLSARRSDPLPLRFPNPFDFKYEIFQTFNHNKENPRIWRLSLGFDREMMIVERETLEKVRRDVRVESDDESERTDERLDGDRMKENLRMACLRVMSRGTPVGFESGVR